MNKQNLRSRVILLMIAPSILIGIMLGSLYVFNKYRDLNENIIHQGLNIGDTLVTAILSKGEIKALDRELVRNLVGFAHRKNSIVVQSIGIFDENHQLIITSNYRPNFDAFALDPNEKIPDEAVITRTQEQVIIRLPILAEQHLSIENLNVVPNHALGYVALELSLSSLYVTIYREAFAIFCIFVGYIAFTVLLCRRLMTDITRPITYMQNMVDKIRRGKLNIRIEEVFYGELDELKKGINALASSLSEYHLDMQNSIDQATSDLRETLEQLEIQNIELDFAKKEAQEAARVKSKFLANMSHELRTPLNGIIGFARQILKTKLTPNQLDSLNTIEHSASSLLSIINDILDFSKLEAGKVFLEKIAFNFEESIEEVINLQAPIAHGKGLEISALISPDIPTRLLGDPLRMQQILTNLIGNAIKFTHHGHVHLEARIESIDFQSICLKFVVKDTGIGISNDQKKQLFEAFNQGDTSISRHYGGTGLGLIITEKLIKKMNGHIGFESEQHQGAEFWFTLTLDLDASYQPIMTDHLIKSVAFNLLYVEPDIHVAESVIQTITNQGHQVTHQTDLHQVVERYDHVLLAFSPKKPLKIDEIHASINLAKSMTDSVLLILPSTELALADELYSQNDIPCLTKPITSNKLLNAYDIVKNRHLQAQLCTPLVGPTLNEELPMTVLAVDDNHANLKLISVLLDSKVRHVVTCTNGLDAIDLACGQPFDLILMDIQMPYMDGLSATQAIKTRSLNQNTPVIAVTAHALHGERERLMAAGMDDYITKPIDETLLFNLLKKFSPTPQVPESIDNALPVIDWSLALKQAANKEDLARELLDLLAKQLIEVTQELNTLLTSQQLDEAEKITQLIYHVHKLHGSCAYSGVPRLKKICASLESLLREGTVDNQSPTNLLMDIEPELFELEDEMSLTLEAIETLLAETV